MSHPYIIITGQYLVTNDPSIGTLVNGAVVCEADRILEIGKYDILKSKYPSAQVIGGQTDIVLPGLINAHGHGRGLSFIQKGYRDAPLELWGERKMGVDPYYDAAYSAIKLIRSGVTTSLVQRSGRNHQRLDAFVDAGMRVSFALGISDRQEFVYDFNDNFSKQLPEKIRENAESVASRPINYQDYQRLVSDLTKKYQGNERVQIQFGPVSLHWCSDELLSRIKSDANSMGLRIHMHLLETVYQREYAKKRFGESAVKHLEHINFLSENVTFAHGVWITSEDIETLSSFHCNLVHNPSSNFSTWGGIMPLIPALDNGIPVALGMDDAGINDDDDFFTEMRLCLKMHRQPFNYKEIASEQVFTMSTINGAKSLGLENQVGTITPGKYADIILLDFEQLCDPYISPNTPLWDAIIYRASPSMIKTVLIGGKIIMENRVINTLDEKQILQTLKTDAQQGQKDPFKLVDQSWNELLPWIKNYYQNWIKDDDLSPFYRYNARM